MVSVVQVEYEEVSGWYGAKWSSSGGNDDLKCTVSVYLRSGSIFGNISTWKCDVITITEYTVHVQWFSPCHIKVCPGNSIKLFKSLDGSYIITGTAMPSIHRYVHLYILAVCS